MKVDGVRFCTIEELGREVYEKAKAMLEEETGVTFERLIELAIADSEGRIVITKEGGNV